MQIVSKLIKIKATFPFDNDFIEKALYEIKINPLRWAIVGINLGKNGEHLLTISVACEDL